MSELTLRLAEMIALNGYQVSTQENEDGFIFDIVHQATMREAVYAFDNNSFQAAFRAMARQYLTDQQLNELTLEGVDVVELQHA